MIIYYVSKIFPLVSRELRYWNSRAEQIPDRELRIQALASINSKKFHAQGGAVYGIYPGINPQDSTRFIVALQTISDYLDNLCDRAGVMDEQAFFQLHLAMLDAIDPTRPISDYYSKYPYKNDSGYLCELVVTCRQEIEKQPSYPLILPKLANYIQRYSELQSYKHLSMQIRETRLRDWALQNMDPASAIYWWEYAAATGSTLGMFLLYAVSSDPNLNPETVAVIDRAYFPWVTGLHILLDYFIDAQEDRETGDYNFTFNYQNILECRLRLAHFLKKSLQACRSLPEPNFHRTIIYGLLAMYLSDSKALAPENKAISLDLIRYASPKCRLYHRCCRLLRLFKRI